ncbi:MAG: hypothetical protein ACRC2T_18545 [Thermoguttaceae bacterium]
MPKKTENHENDPTLAALVDEAMKRRRNMPETEFLDWIQGTLETVAEIVGERKERLESA